MHRIYGMIKEGGSLLRFYSHPYIACPYYHTQGMGTVPVRYVPKYIFNPLPSENRQRDPFPPVDTHQLNESVNRFQELMKQANLLLSRLAGDPEFAKELMSEAQQSNTAKVKELILSTGITIEAKTEYTPTGIRIILENSEIKGQCCDLLVALRW